MSRSSGSFFFQQSHANQTISKRYHVIVHVFDLLITPRMLRGAADRQQLRSVDTIIIAKHPNTVPHYCPTLRFEIY